MRHGQYRECHVASAHTATRKIVTELDCPRGETACEVEQVKMAGFDVLPENHQRLQKGSQEARFDSGGISRFRAHFRALSF